MVTVNTFKFGDIKQFIKFPQYWKCNCGNPKYTEAVSFNVMGYSTITCQCGHELTQAEFERFTDNFRALPPTESGKKFDTAKVRMDLLLDMPRALKAIAGLMQVALTDYEEGSWLKVPNGEKRYRAAHLRHTFERAVNPIDPQFGLDHDVAIALNAMFILELRLRSEKND